MRIALSILAIWLFSSCNGKTHSKQDTLFQNLSKDSVLVQHLASKAKALNLPQLNQGVDSFELRVWYGMAIVSPHHLVTFRYQKPNWTVSRTDYWLSDEWTDGKPTTISFDSSVSYATQATSSAGELLKHIQLFRLDTFPDQKDIPGFDDRVGDGTFYQIELATSRYYKAISYRNPFHYVDSHNQRMRRFISGLTKIGVSVLP